MTEPEVKREQTPVLQLRGTQAAVCEGHACLIPEPESSDAAE